MISLSSLVGFSAIGSENFWILRPYLWYHW
eukprot:SAG11_NODE_22143_length_411_cov_0.839744_1_plen_29_part_01